LISPELFYLRDIQGKQPVFARGGSTAALETAPLPGWKRRKANVLWSKKTLSLFGAFFIWNRTLLFPALPAFD